MKLNMTIIVALIFLAGGPARADSVARPFVIVGEESPPYEYLDDKGKPAGINIELIERIFKELGVACEIRFYPWARAWLMIENGAADAVLSVSHNPAREPFLYFTEEQKQFAVSNKMPSDFLWLTEYVFFINRRLADSVRFDSYEQLKKDGLRVVVNDQYSYDETFLQAGLGTLVRSTPADAMRAITDGTADLYPVDRAVGWALLKAKGEHGSITWLPKPLFSKPYLLGFSRMSGYPEAEALMRRFYDRLRDLRQRGDVEQLTARHLDPVRPARPARPLVFVCEDWPPFEYVKDDRMQGINVDLVGRIMSSLRLAYEIRHYPWSRAWMMAERGQADAVLSVSYHPDREKVLYYTDGQRAATGDGHLPADYLWLSRYGFFVKSRNGDNARFLSYESIIESNALVGLNKGYSYAPGFPVDRFNARQYYDTEAGFLGLIQDEIDVYPMDMTVGHHTLKQMGLDKSVTCLPQVLFSKAYLCPFVRKSDYPGLEGIMYEFYHQLRQLRASGLLPY
jgi:polar amino acid transport system substrate-binding protein